MLHRSLSLKGHRPPPRRKFDLGCPRVLTAQVAILVALSWNTVAHAQPAAGAKTPVPAAGVEADLPRLSAQKWGWRLEVPILLAGRAEGVTPFGVDRAGKQFESGTVLSPLLRLGARVSTIEPLAGRYAILAEYEQDLPTGSWTGHVPIAGDGLPNSAPITTQLRKAWARLSVGHTLHVGGGFMTSHWGLGLVANDGAHGWEPGSARFTDARGGDLVLRGFVGSAPLTAAHVVASLAIDSVRMDEVLLPGDSAYEYVASVLVGAGQRAQGGLFAVYRRQTAADGRSLDVLVLDPAGRLEVDLMGGTLTLEGEAALVLGKTTFGASADVPLGKVLQFGGALRGTLAFARAGGVLDLVYAAGDQNLHDASTRAFHADPNFETGLLLFRYVQAAQTGRGVTKASDPQLVGAPPAGIERLPTRGGLSDAVAVFPRFFVRPLIGLEAYGGVLFAFAPTRNIDPFNTDLAGGTPKNALGGDPGSYWGTEIDLGLRYRLDLLDLHRSELSAGVEGGVLFSGSALGDLAGNAPAPIYGGRILLCFRL